MRLTRSKNNTIYFVFIEKTLNFAALEMYKKLVTTYNKDCLNL